MTDTARTPFPPINLDALKPGTRSDRNLPYSGIMSLDEIAEAEGGPRRAGMHPALGACYVHGLTKCGICAAPPLFKSFSEMLTDRDARLAARQHSHYFKPCPFAEVDVYRVLALFAVTDPCLQHAVKKLLVAGGRGAGKDISQDVKEAVDTLARWQEMRAEEVAS